MITPFFGCAATSPSSTSKINPAFELHLTPGESELARAMPAVGVEYRYPFIDVEPWGTQTIEPIAQLIAAPERNRHRQVSERGRAKPGLQRQQSVLDRQIPAGIASKAAAASMPAFNIPPRSTGPALSTCCSDNPTSCYGLNSFAGRRPDQYRARQRPRQDCFRLRRPHHRISRTRCTHSPRAGVSTRRRFTRSSARDSKPAPTSIAGRCKLCTATMRRSRLGFLTRREGILAGASFKVTAELDRARLRPL
jgi:hypothetical protein